MEGSDKEDDETQSLLSQGEKLSMKNKCSYGLGHIHNDLCAAIWFSYSLVFFQLVAGAGAVLSGILVFIGQGVDALATPVAGYLLDRTSLSRKTWHMIGTIMACLSFPMIFTICTVCGSEAWTQGLYYSGFIIVFQCGWAIVQISHLSILPEMSASDKGRAELTAYRYTATMTSNIAVYLIALGFFYNLRGTNQGLVGPADSRSFQKIASSANIIGLAMSVIYQVSTKRKWKQVGTSVKANMGQDSSFKEKLKKLCETWDIYKVAGVYTSSRLFLTITMVYIPLYVNQVVLTNTEILATVPLVIFISSGICSIFYKHFNYFLGQKVTYILGCILCGLGSGLIFLITEKTDSPHLLYVSAAFFGMGSAFTMVVSLSLAANLIGTQTDCGAFVYSTVTFADKLINGLAVVIVQNMKCSNEEDCPNFYRNVLAYLNGGSILSGLLVFLTLPSPLFTKRSRTEEREVSPKLRG